jgi:cell division protease FtsH
MSETLGPRTFGEKEDMIFLGREIHEQRDYSEKVAEQIDSEINKFIKNAEETARNVIKKEKKSLKAIVDELMKKETIEKERFEKIVGNKEEKSTNNDKK